MKARVVVLCVVLIGGVVGLQALHEQRGGPPASSTTNLLYVRSPEAMRRLALSYDGLLADTYWIRAVQHFGATRRSTETNNRYDLLYPLLDLTTSLDPYRDRYSTRIQVKLGAVKNATVTLTVRRKSGKSWATYASSTVKL